MKSTSKILAIGGMLVTVSALIAGGSAAQAAGFAPSGLNESDVDTTAGKPSPEGPIEERVEQAIEEVNQEGQDALVELGELDTSSIACTTGINCIVSPRCPGYGEGKCRTDGTCLPNSFLCPPASKCSLSKDRQAHQSRSPVPGIHLMAMLT